MIASSLSRKIFIGIMVMFILSLFGAAGWISYYTMLQPTLVMPGLELWRLVTYPIALSFLGLLIGAICFSVPGEEMESMLGTRQFGILLLIVTLGSALMHMAVFYGSSRHILAGPTNPAIFILVGFVYLFPHSEVRVFFFNIRTSVIVAVTAGIIVTQTVYSWLALGESPLMFFSFGGFGLVLGGVYFHTRYQKYAFLLKPIRTVERMLERSRTVAGPHKNVSAPVRQSQQGSARIRIPFQKSTADLSDEERLNLILDRINEKGYGDLSEDEQRFLRDYSSKL
jgi:hypothetical protein